MKIAVAGGTGRVGRHVVDVLKARGHEVVAMSRATGVNVFTGKGLAETLTGAECIIDAVGGIPEGEDDAAPRKGEGGGLLHCRRAEHAGDGQACRGTAGSGGLRHRDRQAHHRAPGGQAPAREGLAGRDAIIAGPTFAEWLERA